MQNNGWIDTFETYAEKVIKDSHLPGVAIELAKDGRVLYERGFGYRDVENQLKVTSDTVFAIGSITKTFTCVALMQLQEKGKLSLHEPIKKYLPDFHLKSGKNADQMTIHHFMTHTSGIPDLKSFPIALYDSLTDDDFKNDPLIRGEKSEYKPVQSYEEYLDYIAQLDIQLLGKPGTQWCYSNDCYGLLAAIIERISGQTYENYITDHILIPAKMFHTSFFLDDLNSEAITKQYVTRVWNGNPVIVASPNWWDTPILRAAGFLKSTINDMLRFSEIFRTGGLIEDERILTDESVKQMTESHFESHPIVGQSYGYGLEVFPHYHGMKMVGHPGGIKGGAGQMSVIAEKGLTGIVLSNFLSTAPTSILNAAFNCMDNRPPEESHVKYIGKPIEKQLLSQYTGNYQSKTMNAVLSIEFNDNQLQAKVLDAPIVLNPIQKDIFLLEGNMDYVQFDRNADNEIISMHYKGLKFSKA